MPIIRPLLLPLARPLDVEALPSAAAEASPGLSEYKLDDDGAVAAAIGFGAFAMDAPEYAYGTYSYTDAATGGSVLAAPNIFNVYASHAIPTAGKILAFEMEIVALPGPAFGGVALLMIPSVGGVPNYGGPCGIGVRCTDGTTAEWNVLGGDDLERVGPAVGARVGIEINGETGDVTLRTSDEVYQFIPVLLPLGSSATFFVIIDDNGDPPNSGLSTTVRVIPHAADMQLAYTSGAVDVFGVVI